jgi:hypothetical protein
MTGWKRPVQVRIISASSLRGACVVGGALGAVAVSPRWTAPGPVERDRIAGSDHRPPTGLYHRDALPHPATDKDLNGAEEDRAAIPVNTNER